MSYIPKKHQKITEDGDGRDGVYYSYVIFTSESKDIKKDPALLLACKIKEISGYPESKNVGKVKIYYTENGKRITVNEDEYGNEIDRFEEKLEEYDW